MLRRLIWTGLYAGPRRRRDDGRSPRRVAHLAHRDRRGAAHQEVRGYGRSPARRRPRCPSPLTLRCLTRRQRTTRSRRSPTSSRRPPTRPPSRTACADARRAAGRRRRLRPPAEAEPDPRAREGRGADRRAPAQGVVAPTGPQLGPRPEAGRRRARTRSSSSAVALFARLPAREGDRLERPCTPPADSTRTENGRPGLGDGDRQDGQASRATGARPASRSSSPRSS